MPTRSLPIIDAHNHPDWQGHDFVRFVANMDQCGIARTWLLCWECPPDEYDQGCRSPFSADVLGMESGPIPFARCLAYQERAPRRFVLGYAPDPRRPGALDRMQAAIDLYGVRICGELKLRMMYDNPDALRLLRFCGERKVPVTVHIDYPSLNNTVGFPRPDYWYGGGIDVLERVLRKCPETIIIGHAPGFWSHISGDDQYDKTMYPAGPVLPAGQVPALLRAYPNLYADLSAYSGLNALSRDPAHAKEFLLEFQDRILYGRDCFDNRLQEFLASLELPKTVLKKIYSGNASALAPISPQRDNGKT